MEKERERIGKEIKGWAIKKNEKVKDENGERSDRKMGHKNTRKRSKKDAESG